MRQDVRIDVDRPVDLRTMESESKYQEWRRGPMPWGVTLLVAFFCAVHGLAEMSGILNLLQDRYRCMPHCISNGEFWRVSTYMMLHVSVPHLCRNGAYLLVVGIVAERTIGRVEMFATWLICGLAGGIGFSIFGGSTPFGLVGASSATHGLLVAIAVRMGIRSVRWTSRVAAGFIIVYLFYTSLHAIGYGRMGWPLHALENPGWDHLSGLMAGVAIGVLGSTSRSRRSRLMAGKSAIRWRGSMEWDC